jgi:hypothetical protein
MNNTTTPPMMIPTLPARVRPSSALDCLELKPSAKATRDVDVVVEVVFVEVDGNVSVELVKLVRVSLCVSEIEEILSDVVDISSCMRAEH